MTDYDQRALVCLYLAGIEAPDEQSPAPARLTATGIGDALEIGETAVDRVELLETLTDLQEAGLVVAEERPVAGSSSPRPVYGLTDAGRDHAGDVRERVSQDSVVVTNGTSEQVTLAQADRYFESEVPLVTALARLTEDGEVPLDRYTGEGFVGRKAELATVREAIEQSSTKESETVLVAGASGMGKTALVREVVSRVRADEPDLLVARGSSPSGASEPYAAFKQAFERLSTGADLREQLTDAQSVMSPADTDELQAQRQALFSDIAAGLREAITAPTVIFLDNLQWADEATLALFEHLVTTFDDWLTPVAFVGTYRLSEVAGTEHPLADVLNSIERDGQYTEVILEPLPQVDTRALLADVLGRHSLPESFVELVHEQTGGNPLFVHETATYLLETGMVDSQTETYPTTTAEISLPAEVTDQIASRLEHLDAESRELLRLGAIVGERVPGDVLATASDLPTGRFGEYVDVLVASRIWEQIAVDEQADTRADGGRVLQFVSGGLREAVVDQLPANLTREYHGHVATAFESVYEDTDEFAARLATHYEQAGDPETAFEYYQQAGDYAAETYANEDAIENYERALSLAEEHDVTAGAGRAAVATDLGDTFELLGEYDRARESYERSLDISRETDDSEREVTSLNSLGNVAENQGEYDEAREYYEESLDIAREIENRHGEAESLHNLGNIAQYCSAFDQAREYYEDSLSIRRELGDRRGAARSLNNLGVIAYHRRVYDEAHEYYERSLDISREIGDRRGESQSLNNLGIIAQFRGEFDEAREYYEESLDIRRAIGYRGGEARNLNNLGFIAMEQGEYDNAREYYESSLDIAREIGDRQTESQTLTNLGIIADSRGDLDRARECYAQSRDIFQELGDRKKEGQALQNLGSIVQTQGEYDQAREYLTESLDVARDVGAAKQEVNTLRELGMLARRRGKYDDATQYLDEGVAVCDGSETPKEHAKIQLEQARLALARNEVESARERTEHARGTLAELDVAEDEAKATRLLGRITAEMGSSEAARDHWREALDTFEAVGVPQDTLETLRYLTETCREQDDDGQAREWVAKAETIFEDAPEPVQDKYRDWLDELGSDV